MEIYREPMKIPKGQKANLELRFHFWGSQIYISLSQNYFPNFLVCPSASIRCPEVHASRHDFWCMRLETLLLCLSLVSPPLFSYFALLFMTTRNLFACKNHIFISLKQSSTWFLRLKKYQSHIGENIRLFTQECRIYW
jgi:hypothetical protein